MYELHVNIYIYSGKLLYFICIMYFLCKVQNIVYIWLGDTYYIQTDHIFTRHTYVDSEILVALAAHPWVAVVQLVTLPLLPFLGLRAI